MDTVSFTLNLPDNKILTFSSETGGLIIDNKEYVALADGVLIYDQTKDLHANTVTAQLATNTSTLIPALRILGLPYNPYFDNRDVVESQNNISFYWHPSRLAAFYNRYNTDGVEKTQRKAILGDAVAFLLNTAQQGDDFLPEEMLQKVSEPCRLLGFYDGFPIFDDDYGMPKLVSRLGIHIGVDSVMVSTPMDKYAEDVTELSKKLEAATGITGVYKKNRTRFPKDPHILEVLGVNPL